ASPFRGREIPLHMLGEAWEHAARGAGAAICLVGEPGIGKSRLAYELRRSLRITEHVEGMALGHARGAPYFVFRQLLRQLARVGREADLAEVRDALHRRLWDLSPELAGAVPEILPVMGASCEALAPPAVVSGDERRDRVRDAIVAWIAAEAR